jgi:anti-sigma factor RsiW
MDCALVRDHLDAYVDGELEPTPVIELEGHLRACTPCRDEVKLTQLVKSGVQSIPRPAMAADGQARVLAALDDTSGGKRAKGATAAMVMAAAVLLAVVATQRPTLPPVGEQTASAPTPEFLRQVVDGYAGELPPEAATRPDQVAPMLSSKVGFRVRPVEFGSPEVQLIGARAVRLEGQPAAQLDYSVGKRRLTLFVFQPNDEARELLHEEDALQRSGGRRQRVGSRMVTYHNVRGYPVPMLEQGGLAYAFTGDLDEQTLLRLLASAQL